MSVTLYHGDCLDVIRSLPEGIADAVVTDPPYELSFMGKSWDSAGISYDPETWRVVMRALKPGGHLVSFGAPRTYHRIAVAIEDAGFEIRDCILWLYGSGFPKSKQLLKPAYEPIMLARKPGKPNQGALNIEDCRIATDDESYYNTNAEPGGHSGSVYGLVGYDSLAKRSGGNTNGRWPANVILDEVAAEMLDAQSGVSTTPTKVTRGAGGQHGKYSPIGEQRDIPRYGDTGGASRFFYCAKASKRERNAGFPEGEKNTHPTVKPLSLIRYLVRLVTPGEGGVVLDPFAGSGTTGAAAEAEGRDAILIEREEEYISYIGYRVPSVLHISTGEAAD